jgi:hypothetical protein
MALNLLKPTEKVPSIVLQISGLLSSFGKISGKTLISKEPTKIVEKLSVNLRCNSIYSKDSIDVGVYFVANLEKLGSK